MSLTPATAETLRHTLATVVVVPVTPLSADGDPDWDTYAALTGRLIDGGIRVITPNGNTGEACGAQAFSLRPGQRQPRPGPVDAGRTARERLRRRDEGVGVGAPVRGTASGGLLGRQRERGQGSHGPAGPVPRGRPAASRLLPPGIKQEITRILPPGT